MDNNGSGGKSGRRRQLVGRLWVIMVTGFVDMIGFLVVLPLLPFYARRFGATPTTVGLLVGAFAFAQLVASPIWGRLSDRYGRRPIILGGIALSAAAFVLFGFAESVLVLFLSRLVQGAGGGTVGAIQAYVSDRSSPDERAKALGWVTAATSAGVMVGPAVGSLAFQLGESAPGFVAAGLCLLNFAFVSRWLPEAEDDDPAAEDEPLPSLAAELWIGLKELVTSFVAVLRVPSGRVASLIWVYAVSMMAFMSMNGVLALYLDDVFAVTEATIGYFYIYVGAVSLVMRALLLGPIVDRLGEVRTLRLGIASLALGFGLLPLPRSLWTLGLTVLLIPVGTALLFPATTSLVASRARRRQVGQTLGLQQTFGGFSRWLGPMWAGFVYQHLGISSPFWIASGLVALTFLWALRISPKKDSPGEATSPAADMPAAVAEPPDPA